MNGPIGTKEFLYRSINKGEVSLFLGLLGWGSEKVSQISDTSSLEKKCSMKSIFVLRNRTFSIFWSFIVFAPFHILAPFISTPIKFVSGFLFDNPIVYSPLPHPSSSTIGLSFLNSKFHFPLIL